MVTAIEGAGTREDEWAGWPVLAALPPLFMGFGQPPVIVAPHPDDEILGLGGLLSVIGDAFIVAVTDGEASHPGSSADLTGVREKETAEALNVLGLGHLPVERLRQPDGGIDEVGLADALTPLLEPGQWCFATWRGDGHPDHEATGRAAAEACFRTGAILAEYPIWMWHWATPDDPRVPWGRARRIDLPATIQAAKREAVAAFRSQTEPLGADPADAPVLPPHVLDRLLRPFETVFVA